MIGERVAAYRLKNAAALQMKVHEEVGKLGLRLDRSSIPERYALSWFEEATKHAEPEIQVLFARLLAKAATGDQDALDRRHLELLSQFIPIEARLLQRLPDLGLKLLADPAPLPDGMYRAIIAEEGLEQASMAFEHLTAPQVFESTYTLLNGEYLLPDPSSIEKVIVLSATGASLCRALAIFPD
ncbi:hypothetical protein HMF7854_10945 [Sphingomonas ginkgonis]|uniref:Uncharacterized protein n=1 Tax=Sphingomonas ginkgonis TaxID=2315330 RepID=A0A429VBG1_9SPHN|nr:hypothetical protein [Sphingomonas ginkgonis]RST31294.1 hypothetical protein HMF7854_10945 [Sphingomonas ginkgonis]